MGFALERKPFILTAVLFVSCSGIQNVCLDLNDILSSNWMPGTLMENMDSRDYHRMSNYSAGDANEKKVFDGTISNALDTMTFHR